MYRFLLWKNDDGDGGRMDSTIEFGRWNTLYTMNAGFISKFPVDIVTADLHGDIFVCFCGRIFEFGAIHYSETPVVELSVTLIHAS